LIRARLLPESEARQDLAIGLRILDRLALRSLLQRLVVAVLVMQRPRHVAARQLLLDVTISVQRYPKIKLKFMLGTERADFVKQSIDVAIHSEQPTELSLVAKALIPRPWVVAAAPAYFQKFAVPETPDELMQHGCLNFTLRTQWNSWTLQEAVAPTTVVTIGHLSADLPSQPFKCEHRSEREERARRHEPCRARSPG